MSFTDDSLIKQEIIPCTALNILALNIEHMLTDIRVKGEYVSYLEPIHVRSLSVVHQKGVLSTASFKGTPSEEDTV